MFGIFSRQFHKQTNFDFPVGQLPLEPQYWPKEWKEIYRKEYPRMPRVELSKNILPLGSFENALENRRSEREYDPNKKITLPELTTLIYYTAGVKPQEDNWNSVRRFYPSGGARYPMEMYFLIQSVEEIVPGIYHYNVKEHFLEQLSVKHDAIEEMKRGLYYSWARDAAVVAFFSAVWDRNFMKYKDRGYRIVLMEAGHMAQNLSLAAAALNLKCCNAVAFNNDHIAKILDIENEDEDTLYMATLGK